MNNYSSFFKILGRAFFYSLTTAFALIAGYLITGTESYNFILLGIPFSFSISFFVKYSYCFHYQEDGFEIDGKRLIEILRICFWFISIPLSTIFILVYKIEANQFPSIPICTALFIFALLFSRYGSFLLRNNHRKEDNIRQNKEILTVRHRILWPTIMTIAFCIYLGVFFEKLDTFSNLYLYFYIPIVAIIIFFLSTEKKKNEILTNENPDFKKSFEKNTKNFIILNFLFWFLLIGITILFNVNHKLFYVPEELKLVSSAILICMGISAYLGILESWRITAFERKSNEINNSDIEHTYPVYLKWEKYYYNILGVLILIICCLPFVYIMSPYGTFFFILFVTHSIVSLIIWGKLGRRSSINHFLFINTEKRELQNYWIFTKSFMGFIFLLILNLASKYSSPPTKSLFSLKLGLYILPFLTPFIFIQGRTIKKENDKYCERYGDIGVWFWVFFRKYVNYLRLASLLSFLFAIITLFVKYINPNEDIAYKADYAFSLYVLMIIFSLNFEIYYYIRIKNKGQKLFKIILKIFGIIQATRISTSVVISAIVLLPIAKDINHITNVIFLAMNLLFTSMGGFALNDFYDFEKDKVNKPHRPIPSKRITGKTTLKIAVLFLSLSLLFSIYNTFNYSYGFLQILFLAAMIFYNYVTKNFALAKTIYTAFISALLVLYPILLYSFSFNYILLPIATFFFIMGREIFMDILDVGGDKKSGITTIPIKYGMKISTICALSSLIIGTLLVTPLFIFSITYSSYILWSIILLSVLFFSLLWFLGSNKNKKIAIIYLWVPMIMALIKLSL